MLKFVKDGKKPENFVIVDMYEMAFTSPEAKKPILLTFNLRPCFGIAARNNENGFTGLIHLVEAYYLMPNNQDEDKKFILNILKKFFNNFRNKDENKNKTIDIDLHLYGLENNENDLEVNLILRNFIDLINNEFKDFNFNLMSCGFNRENNPEKIIDSYFKNEIEVFKEIFIEEINSLSDDKKKDQIFKLRLKNFAIDSKSGKFFNKFNLEMHSFCEDFFDDHRSAGHKIQYRRFIKYLNDHYEIIYHPSIINNGLIDFRFIDQNIINCKHFKSLDIKELFIIIDQIKNYEFRNKLQIETIEQIQEFVSKEFNL